MNDSQTIQCPWCWEELDFYVDPDSEGVMVEDCAVCCRPWQVHVYRQEDGLLAVQVARSN